MMHISMIFDLDACICDAGFFHVGPTNERTNKPISDACIPDAGFFPDGRMDQLTDGQADSRSWIYRTFCVFWALNFYRNNHIADNDVTEHQIVMKSSSTVYLALL